MITRNGKPAVVMVAPEGAEDLENFVLLRSPRLRAMLDRSRLNIEAGQGLSEEEFWSAIEQRQTTPTD